MVILYYERTLFMSIFDATYFYYVHILLCNNYIECLTCLDLTIRIVRTTVSLVLELLNLFGTTYSKRVKLAIYSMDWIMRYG